MWLGGKYSNRSEIDPFTFPPAYISSFDQLLTSRLSTVSLDVFESMRVIIRRRRLMSRAQTPQIRPKSIDSEKSTPSKSIGKKDVEPPPRSKQASSARKSRISGSASAMVERKKK
jgi:hypothetical protein